MIRTTLWGHPDVPKHVVNYITSDHVYENENIKNILILTQNLSEAQKVWSPILLDYKDFFDRIVKRLGVPHCISFINMTANTIITLGSVSEGREAFQGTRWDLVIDAAWDRDGEQYTQVQAEILLKLSLSDRNEYITIRS